MKTTSKDKAIDSIIGADGFIAITARNLGDDTVSISVFHHGDEAVSNSIANEMLYVVRKMLFGPDGNEVQRIETPESGGD